MHLVQVEILREKENGWMASHNKLYGHLKVLGLGESQEDIWFLVSKFKIKRNFPLNN
jgi:hypothetical protein